MDIAKIRKKLKDTGQQGEAESRAESGAVPREVEDLESPGTIIRSEERVVESGIKKEEGGDRSPVEILTFILGREEYAFKISEVQEIIRPLGVTMIPNSKDYLLGITSLRGKIIPVVNLKKMLSLDGKTAEGDKKQRILILKGPKGPVGAIVDRIIGVIRTSIPEIVETPQHLPEAEMKFIEGVVIEDGRFVSIIRIDEVVNI